MLYLHWVRLNFHNFKPVIIKRKRSKLFPNKIRLIRVMSLQKYNPTLSTALFCSWLVGYDLYWFYNLIMIHAKIWLMQDSSQPLIIGSTISFKDILNVYQISNYFTVFFWVVVWIWKNPKSVLVVQYVKICLQCRIPRSDAWVGKISWRREWLTHSSMLVWRFPWTETIGRGITKSQTWLSENTQCNMWPLNRINLTVCKQIQSIHCTYKLF